jgi:hypothetical protein
LKFILLAGVLSIVLIDYNVVIERILWKIRCSFAKK